MHQNLGLSTKLRLPFHLGYSKLHPSTAQQPRGNSSDGGKEREV